MKPFFSIIIPTLNEEKFIGKLLSDIIKQTYHDFEVVIIDAHSEDKTIQEVNTYKSIIERLRIVRIRERNVSKQRNKGAHIAKGSYLVFLDADTRIHSSFLKKIHTYIVKNKGLILLPALSCIEKDIQMSIAMDFGNALIAVSNTVGRPFSSGGSMIVEKNIFHTIGGFPENVMLSEDHLLVQNAHRFGVHARFLSAIKVKVSLRRFNREGKLAVFFKYIKGTIYFLAKGKVDKKIIQYEMGGHLYDKRSKKVLNELMKINPQKLLKGFNKNIRVFIRKLDL